MEDLIYKGPEDGDGNYPGIHLTCADGGDPFHAAACRRQQEEKARRIKPGDGEDLICRSAYFPQDVKTFGGQVFKAKERLVIVGFRAEPYPIYTLMGGMDRKIECRRERFRLIPLSSKAR